MPPSVFLDRAVGMQSLCASGASPFFRTHFDNCQRAADTVTLENCHARSDLSRRSAAPNRL